MMADQNGITESGRKESNCVRCRNHGLKIVLRGHKQYCPYAACACDKCRFTAEQQRQMRLQNAIRRSEGGSGERVATPGRRPRNSNSTAPTMVSPQPHHQQQQQQQQQQQHQTIQQVPQPQPQPQVQQQQIIVTTVSSGPPDQRNGGTPHEEKKMLFDCSSELLKKFRYPWEMMPIMYALAKYANGNIDEIMQRIDEGQFAVNEQLRLQTLNMYFGAAQQNNATVPATRECG